MENKYTPTLNKQDRSAAARTLRVNQIVLRYSKDRLPPALAFFGWELGELSKADHHGEVSGSCPFHHSRSGKSFKVNVESGLWYCHGCGFGGDMVEFCRRRYGFSFLEAARYLGALEETGRPAAPSAMVTVQYLVLDFDVDGIHYRASVKDEPRNYAGMIRHFRREASARLTALGMDKVESDEAETCWARLALATDELRKLGTL